MTLTRRTILTAATAALATTPLAAPRAQKPVTVSWWYHFDDPKATPDALIATFEKQNPGIKIQAESIPWGGGGDYDTRLYTALIAGNGPDAAMVKFQNMPRLLEMEALAPLDKHIDAWSAKGDISDDLWKLHGARMANATIYRCSTWCCTSMSARIGSCRRTSPCRHHSIAS